ncbi:hypothetical protein V1264_013769 [Littorina saxatilis]|uniref:Reverse transcriptase domain-containing protein n=1 Tax=Littorina saxatilis TaxID=31220 RepID=A0AAN9BR29_9CAEN
METPTSIRESLRPSDWATSIDLTDAYFHVLIHPSDRKWLRFRWAEKAFQFRALPFGLSLAPWIFTMVTRQLCSLVRQKGIRLRAYLDDWLTLHQDRLTCSLHTQFVLSQSADLGFCVNQDKSELTPSQTFTYLGMIFDTVAWTVRPSLRRVDRLQTLLTSLRSQEQAPVRTLASALGQMESMATIVPLGSVFKRPFLAAFGSVWEAASQGWDVSVPIQGWIRQTTEQWLQAQFFLDVPIVLPPPDQDMFTDASMVGWGAHLAHLTASGVWSATQSLLHINMLELEAVFLALQSFLPTVMGKHVRLHTDNTTVVAYVNRQGGSRSHSLSDRTCHILLLCQQHHIILSAKFLPGSLNVLADSLSRSSSVIHTEWTITHQALQRLWVQVDKPLVDLFATRFSRRLLVFVSPFPDPETWKTNALEIDWSGLAAYAFPPVKLLGKVLRKVEMERPSLILVAPMWPSQHWFPDLLRLAVGTPIPLNLRKGELLQPRTGILHDNPQSLRLHGWRL